MYYSIGKINLCYNLYTKPLHPVGEVEPVAETAVAGDALQIREGDTQVKLNLNGFTLVFTDLGNRIPTCLGIRLNTTNRFSDHPAKDVP